MDNEFPRSQLKANALSLEFIIQTTSSESSRVAAKKKHEFNYN